jgi:hypothetical protein
LFRRLSHGKLFLLEIDRAMESSHRPSPTPPQPIEESGRNEEREEATGPCVVSSEPEY